MYEAIKCSRVQLNFLPQSYQILVLVLPCTEKRVTFITLFLLSTYDLDVSIGLEKSNWNTFSILVTWSMFRFLCIKQKIE